ncbi:MAG: ATP-dependent zinc metalloprotease FtsH [Blastocatellia bacterium]|nr:ATP-dependent zinc metalloprotease FtsH [Blastocatellia bacterium]MCS7156455.1 ATP-dependent zinc metalloprotease FtsH [Blastocatellia bacterium]MCX7751804.1 ATP-dependent zinc metalloprotease FtsH [Blastocatellia bacterium]MDW8168906.1 ATP-dependent zinc metalloprotease FtsH [Acidobacteriota bacterium]MDW8256666.1 ATP-dependent zinc metalloprotease FtsH [Acidobacteriota bacterium]
MDKLTRQRWIFSGLYLLFVLGVLFSIQQYARVRPQPIAYSELLDAVRNGKVAEVWISESEIRARLSEGEKLVAATRVPGIEDTALLEELEERRVKFSGVIERASWWEQFFLYWILPLVILVALWGYGMRRLAQGGSGVLTFGRSKAKIYDTSSENRVTFADVAGVDEAKAELMEIVDFLRHPARYQRLGGRIPKGVLLIGPPGTGKTLLARAVAGEAGVPFFAISGSEFVEMFVGVGAARVRDLFEQAKRRAPCIVFIDELDAIGKMRSVGGGLVGAHDEREQTLNQLLVEMDGFDSSKGVIIMAATNRPEILDPALLRAGRFDRRIVIDKPDVKGREEILRVHVRKIRLAPDVDLRIIAARTPGMVGADLANIVNEAALLAARRGAEAVEMQDFENAIDRILLGLEKKGRVMSPEEKERVAYHEVGHALCALSVPHADPVHKVTIIPRTIGALGATLQLPTEDRYLLTKPQLEDRLVVLLGGRAAEELSFGNVSTGAHNDLEQATEIARQMVMRFGMSERLGPLTYGRPWTSQFLQGSVPLGEERNFSEQTARLIDEEVQRVVTEAYERARAILRQKQAALHHVARELIKRETLDREELEQLVRESMTAAAHVPTE